MILHAKQGKLLVSSCLFIQAEAAVFYIVECFRKLQLSQLGGKKAYSNYKKVIRKSKSASQKEQVVQVSGQILDVFVCKSEICW